MQEENILYGVELPFVAAERAIPARNTLGGKP
jgi:hypothetical protein